MDALVEARSVEMTFASGRSGRRVNIHVLRKISFDVGYGETLGLVGESG
jgi:ABC-type oligopeptide transport system ATPase subunit